MITASIQAQVKFSTVVSAKEIGLDEYVQVDYTIENGKSVENFSAPNFKNFTVLQGPSQSENVTIINGVVSRSKSISYVLQPTAMGKQVVPGAMASVDGKTMHSEAVTIQVNKKGTGQSNQQQFAPPSSFMPDMFEGQPQINEEYRLKPGEDIKEKIAKNLIVKLDVNKTTCYQGEPLIASYKLCSRIKSESSISKRPSLNGFSVYDMVQPGTENVSVEKINGKNFNVHLIRRSQLFPLQPGTYTLDPVVLENKVEFLRTNSNRSSSPQSGSPIQRMMDRFFNQQEKTGEIETRSVTLQSNPVKITVLPLPAANKPSSFNGAVGKFTLAAELKNKSIAAGDAIELQVVVKGSGNLPVINAPDINLPQGIEAFDPLVKEDIDKTVYPLSGSKMFTYTFIAQNEGSFTIPAIQFSYFDPASTSYKTLNSDSFKIEVKEGTLKRTNLADSNNSAPAKLAPPSQWTFLTSPQMLGMIAIILVLLGVIVYLLIKSRKQQEKPTAIPPISEQIFKEENVTISADPLLDARLALMQGNSQTFYAALNKALREACNVATNKEAFQSIIKECEFALYTPVHEAKDMELLLSKAEKLFASK